MATQKRAADSEQRSNPVPEVWHSAEGTASERENDPPADDSWESLPSTIGTSEASEAEERSTEPSVGETFRHRREEFGLTLEDIEADLCIRKSYVTAIETSDFDSLPGMTYALGFVRAYADHVGLDRDNLVRRFKEEAALASGAAATPPPAPTIPKKIIRKAIRKSPKQAAIAPPTPSIAKPPPAKPRPTKPRVAKPRAAKPARRAAGSSPRKKWGSIGRAVAVAAVVVLVGAVAFVVLALQGMRETEVAGSAANELAVSNGVETKVSFSSTPPANAATGRIDSGSGDPSVTTVAIVPTIGGGTLEGYGTRQVGEHTGLPPVGVDETGDDLESDEDARLMPRPKDRPFGGTPKIVSLPAPAPEPGAQVAALPPPEEVGAMPAAAAPAPAPIEPVTPNPPPRPTVNYGASEGSSRVAFTARDTTRIQVQSTTGEILFDGVLLPGDVYHVPNRNGLLLHTDSAGGLKFTVDEQPVPSIGPRGAQRENVFLNPMLLREGRAAPN